MLKPVIKLPKLPSLVPTAVKVGAKNIGNTLYNNSPKIFVCAGGGLILAGTIDACRASMAHAHDISEAKKGIESLKAYYKEVQNSANPDSYTKKQYHKEVADIILPVAADFAMDLIRPGALLLGGYIGIGVGVNQLDSRYFAMAGIANGLAESFEQYRKNVIEEAGEEADARYMYGLTDTKGVDSAGADTDGDEKKELSAAENEEVPKDIYTFYFRRGNPHWDSNNNFNVLFLINAQRDLTTKLHIEGSLFRSEAIKMLGGTVESGDIVYPRDNLVGWKMGNGDDCVDFGIFDADGHIQPWVRKFMASHDDCIPIRLNCDGNILKILSKEGRK